MPNQDGSVSAVNAGKPVFSSTWHSWGEACCHAPPPVPRGHSLYPSRGGWGNAGGETHHYITAQVAALAVSDRGRSDSHLGDPRGEGVCGGRPRESQTYPTLSSTTPTRPLRVAVTEGGAYSGEYHRQSCSTAHIMLQFFFIICWEAQQQLPARNFSV